MQPQEVDKKSNEITAIPEFIEALAVKGIMFAFDSMNTQKSGCDPVRRASRWRMVRSTRKTQGKRTKKTINAIVNSGNHYLAAVKGNQPTLYRSISRRIHS